MDDKQNSTDFPRKVLSMYGFLITDLCVDARHWIGLNDISEEGNFFWVATSMVSKTHLST